MAIRSSTRRRRNVMCGARGSDKPVARGTSTRSVDDVVLPYVEREMKAVHGREVRAIQAIQRVTIRLAPRDRSASVGLRSLVVDDGRTCIATGTRRWRDATGPAGGDAGVPFVCREAGELTTAS